MKKLSYIVLAALTMMLVSCGMNDPIKFSPSNITLTKGEDKKVEVTVKVNENKLSNSGTEMKVENEALLVSVWDLDSPAEDIFNGVNAIQTGTSTVQFVDRSGKAISNKLTITVK